jgi:putative transcriptional regulator
MPGTIRNRVSELCGRKRISIAELARLAGISYQTVYSLYHDNSVQIHFSTLAALCEALNAEVGEIFEYVPICLAHSCI